MCRGVSEHVTINHNSSISYCNLHSTCAPRVNTYIKALWLYICYRPVISSGSVDIPGATGREVGRLCPLSGIHRPRPPRTQGPIGRQHDAGDKTLFQSVEDARYEAGTEQQYPPQCFEQSSNQFWYIVQLFTITVKPL